MEAVFCVCVHACQAVKTVKFFAKYLFLLTYTGTQGRTGASRHKSNLCRQNLCMQL